MNEPVTRAHSRCEKCGKRIAYLGAPLPRPCPVDADIPAECSEVMASLVLARRLRTECRSTEPYRPETIDLLQRSHGTWDAVDSEIVRLANYNAAKRFLRYDTTMLVPVADWISGDWDRATIVAKWAISQINICDGSTMGDIMQRQAVLAREIGEHVGAMSDDLEFDVEPSGP